MVHNEMSFLFGEVPIPGTVQPGSPSSTVYNNMNGNTGDIYGYIDTSKYERVFKNKTYEGNRNGGVIGYLGDVIYDSNRIGQDSYISLLDYFNGMGGENGNRHGPPSMTLKAADFVYLKDLGVYPINRLIILRRYRDGVVVPANLSLFNERPISTVIGWVKVDDDNKELFSINFNEKWVEQTDTLDKVIQKIMKEQFKISTEVFMPIPGWSQGFLFGFLNKMKLTDYTSTNVPTGDPNVLRTSMMRDVESQSLLSELKITFETSYEQKYIDGVDPSLAFQDIIANLVRMGTSDMKFILKGDSEVFKQFFQNVLQGGGGSVNAWTELGKKLIDAFISTVGNFFNSDGEDDFSSQYKPLIDKIKKEKNTQQENSTTGTSGSGTSGTSGTVTQSRKGLFNADIDFSKISEFFTDSIQTILAGSVYRYRWPLIGSIGLMSGLATTPWHLTIGNPFSPILNMNNIVVSNVELKFSSELGFNDMPKRVDAIIDIKMARPFGSQEINRMFNNQYGRIYSKPTGTSGTSGTSTTFSGGTLPETEIVAKRP